MGIWQSPKISAPPNTDNVQELQKYVKQLANTVAMMAKDLDFTINGNMDSRNTREIGGYNVDLTELKSKNGTVGISSYNDPDPSVDDVRFWAGNVDKNTAPWKVTEAGKMYATGAEISTKNGYPRIVIDPEGNFIGVEYDADNFIRFEPDISGSPVIRFRKDGTNVGSFVTTLGYLEIFGLTTLMLNAPRVTVYNWSHFYNRDETKTLQDEFNEIYDRLEALEGP